MEEKLVQLVLGLYWVTGAGRTKRCIVSQRKIIVLGYFIFIYLIIEMDLALLLSINTSK